MTKTTTTTTMFTAAGAGRGRGHGDGGRTAGEAATRGGVCEVLLFVVVARALAVLFFFDLGCVEYVLLT